MATFPNFELAPLRKFDPKLLHEMTVADRFILSMAHAFNEMKFLYWAYETLVTGSVDQSLTPHSGQMSGMINQAARLLYACAHEVLVAVKKASHNRVFKDQLFQRVIDGLDPTAQLAWRQLVKAATTGKSDIKNYTYVVRNRLAFHYCDDEDLAKGYKRFFFDAPRSPRNAFAFASLGNNMEMTRFYFADAAATEASDLADGTDVLGPGKEVLLSINVSLRFVVAGYITLKEAQVAATADRRL